MGAFNQDIIDLPKTAGLLLRSLPKYKSDTTTLFHLAFCPQRQVFYFWSIQYENSNGHTDQQWEHPLGQRSLEGVHVLFRELEPAADA